MRRVQSGVAEVPRVGRLRCVGSRMELASVKYEFAFASRQSPKTALAPAILGLRQAAEANKLRRIARRFAALRGSTGGRQYGQNGQIEGVEAALFE